jgi:hypothetical protein
MSHFMSEAASSAARDLARLSSGVACQDAARLAEAVVAALGAAARQARRSSQRTRPCSSTTAGPTISTRLPVQNAPRRDARAPREDGTRCAPLTRGFEPRSRSAAAGARCPTCSRDVYRSAIGAASSWLAPPRHAVFGWVSSRLTLAPLMWSRPARPKRERGRETEERHGSFCEASCALAALLPGVTVNA